MSAIAVWVQVQIKPECMDEFKKVMEVDAVESRKEPGCLRFDLLADADKPDVFYFYEVYKDADAMAEHKKTAHYKMWADFKAAEAAPVVSQTVCKASPLNFQ